jgi:[ribosomal protein S5]-alanine N-acetyltransferase
MQEAYTTDRLTLKRLAPNDNAFIFELLNTKGWIQFIGNRNIETMDDADKYIQKIMNNPNVVYWVVQLKETRANIGLITFIKRDYLDHHDIGFAFLPKHANNGYAFEAAKTVLTDLLKVDQHQTIVATTLPNNAQSIKLLEKLGLQFVKIFENENEALCLFAIHAA